MPQNYCRRCGYFYEISWSRYYMTLQSCPLDERKQTVVRSLHFEDKQLEQWQDINHLQSHGSARTVREQPFLLSQTDKHGRR